MSAREKMERRRKGEEEEEEDEKEEDLRVMLRESRGKKNPKTGGER